MRQKALQIHEPVFSLVELSDLINQFIHIIEKSSIELTGTQDMFGPFKAESCLHAISVTKDTQLDTIKQTIKESVKYDFGFALCSFHFANSTNRQIHIFAGGDDFVHGVFGYGCDHATAKVKDGL